jgi:hypothetical protein
MIFSQLPKLILHEFHAGEALKAQESTAKKGISWTANLPIKQEPT